MESKGASSSDLAGVGVEVEGVVMMALVDYGDKAGGGGWDVAYASGLDDAGEAGLTE